MKKREIFIICILSLLVCLVAISSYSSNNFAKIKIIIEENIDAYGTGKIVKITPHPKLSNFFILQTSTDWWDSVYWLSIKNSTIDKSDLIVYGESKTIANFVFLEGFNDYFIEFYYSTHMGNGGYILYDPKFNYSTTDIYGVFDFNLESRNYPELIERFGYNEYSFVFKDDFLNVRHVDLNGDGYSDLEFTESKIYLIKIEI